MTWYQKIKKYYEERLWTKAQVLSVVGKVLTAEEAQEIIGGN